MRNEIGTSQCSNTVTYLFLQVLFVLHAFNLFSIRVVDLFLQAAGAVLTGCEPFSENIDDVLDVLCLNVASNSGINLELSILLI